MFRKIFVIFSILLLIFFSGCINDTDNKEKIRDATANDLELMIELLNVKNNNTWQFNNSIQIRLSNIESVSIKIESHLILGLNIKGNITTPENNTYPIIYSTLPLIKPETIILKPGEFIEKTDNYLRDTGRSGKIAYDDPNFGNNGTYSVQLFYTGVTPYVFSNIVYFNIN